MAYIPADTTETDKIDIAASDGLTGVEDSVSYRIHEAERHFHSPECWLGAAAAPAGETHVADVDMMTPFVVTSGNDTWGPWIQIAGSDDTPCRAGMVKLDLHRVLVVDVSADANKKQALLQLAGGTSGAAALAAGAYTTANYVPEKDGKSAPIVAQDRRFLAGTKGWARLWVEGEDAETHSIKIGLHEYEG